MNNKHTEYPLLPEDIDLLSTRHVWSYNADWGFIFTLPESLNKMRTYIAPPSTIAKVHPQLPSLLAALYKSLEAAADNGVIETPGPRELRNNLMLLNNEGVALKMPAGTECYFLEVYGINALAENKDCVGVLGAHAVLKNVEIDDEAVTFVTSSVPNMRICTKASLEEQFPGWENRWLVACELGLEDEDLVNFVLAPSEKPSNTLPDTDVGYA